MKYDVSVLGGGPGGYEAAIRCAQNGLSTVLIEAEELGGTCLNRGCIPTKALLRCAQLFDSVKRARDFGITAKDIEFDFTAMARRKDAVVTRLREGVAFLEKSHGVTVVKGFGRLAGSKTIEVGGESIESGSIILAAGSAPALPPIPGIDCPRVLTSDGVLSMGKTPESVVMIGAGVIGIEFATLFALLGIPVTVLEMLPEILPELDRDIARALTQLLKRRGVNIISGVKVTDIDSRDNDISVGYLTSGGEKKRAEAECCVACAGRSPRTRGIGLAEAGVETDGRGYVITDEFMRTSAPGIYAVGDITGGIQLAHAASAQGMAAAAGCAGKPEAVNMELVPSCIYTEPEIAVIGKGRRRLEEAGIPFKEGSFRAGGNGRAVTMGETDGLVRLYSSPEDGRILGAQIMAPGATDMISEIAAAMRFGGTVSALGELIHPHPTLSEMIMEAALDADGRSCHNPKPRA